MAEWPGRPARRRVWQAHEVLLVLWDIDGTLVHTAGHGRYAFEEAFRERGRSGPCEVEAMPAGPTTRSRWRCSTASASSSRACSRSSPKRSRPRKEAIASDGRAYPGVAETLAALHARDDVMQSLLTGNIESNAAIKVSAFGLERWLDFEVGAYGSDPPRGALRPGGGGARAGRPQVRRAGRRGAGGRHAAGRPRRARGGRPGGGGGDRLLPIAKRCAPPAPTRCCPTCSDTEAAVRAIAGARPSRFHLMLQPTGSVSGGAGSSPASTASSASRSQRGVLALIRWSASGAPR